jgi:hypothetical protein
MLFPHDEDPEYASLRAAQHERHGLTIAYIKKRVGDGAEYANEVAHAVLSEHGGYYQLSELPEEFAGALGAGVSHRLIHEREAWEILHQVQTLVAEIVQGTQTVQAISLYALYAGGSLRTREKMFVFDQRPGESPFTHGAWQRETLPRFLKLRLDCGDAPAPTWLGLTQGVLFFLTPQNRDDGCSLIATLAQTPATQDLSLRPSPTMMN